MLKQPIDVVFCNIPCSGGPIPSYPRRMRELTAEEVSQVSSSSSSSMAGVDVVSQLQESMQRVFQQSRPAF